GRGHHAGFFQVGAGAEGGARAGDHDRAHGVVGAPGLELRDHRIDHFAVQGVHGLGPGQRDPGHAALEFKLDAHSVISSLSEWIDLTMTAGYVAPPPNSPRFWRGPRPGPPFVAQARTPSRRGPGER